MATELGSFEETHPTISAVVGFFRLLLVGFFVRFAVAGLGEAFPTDGTRERLLTGVHPLVTHKLVEFTECLFAV